jgi:hypothetical protein
MAGVATGHFCHFVSVDFGVKLNSLGELPNELSIFDAERCVGPLSSSITHCLDDDWCVVSDSKSAVVVVESEARASVLWHVSASEGAAPFAP